MLRETVILTCDAPNCTADRDVDTVRGNLGWRKDREIELCPRHRAGYDALAALLYEHGRRAGAPVARRAAGPGIVPVNVPVNGLPAAVVAGELAGGRAQRYRCPDCPKTPLSPQGYRSHRRRAHGVGAGTDPLPAPI